MCAAQVPSLFWIESRVDAAVDNPGPALASHTADLHAAQSIAGMDADPHNIATLDELRLNLFERFISDDRIAILGRRSRGEYV